MKKLAFTTASILALTVAAASAVTLTDLDTNADGSADFGEVRAVAPTISQEEYNSIDTDGSNGWDDTEFGMAAEMLLKHLPESSGPAIKLDLGSVDTNADGSADMGEVLAVSPTVTEAEFNMVDADGSGGWDEIEMTGTAMMLLAKGQLMTEGDGVVSLGTLDSNGDGSADIGEVLAVSPTVSQAEFNMVDTDGSAGWDEPEMTGQAQMLLARK
ncbi:hypothetical protein ACEN2J_05740 [Pseudorhodobacter sp. W20_MBD10_FR17]|uniref:hypothetical protein n=1 Tax=Pseudorhodobacter sp. W20_MBD10_FR17 TaxID=3240266 RepID=UPI003F9B5E79